MKKLVMCLAMVAYGIITNMELTFKMVPPKRKKC